MSYIFLLYLAPLISSVFLALPFKYSEKLITRLSTITIILPTIGSMLLSVIILGNESFPIEVRLMDIATSGNSFPLKAWVDQGSFTMLGLTHVLSLLVLKFSHGYLHLEKGFQRFFSTILFFIFGMFVLSLAGNFDLFFAGWEIVGFSSFLLIAFYRDHSKSVNNAWRIYNLYRVCDIGLLMSSVLGHILWHEATRFSQLKEMTPESFIGTNHIILTVLYFLLLIASLGKSAQFPFHNWPARAMEGPTPSSAIFYGALSIHAGVFLLFRTQPLWSHNLVVTSFIGLTGFLTLIFSSIQGRIQTNIKGQIAYASTAQIGIMFIELAFGLTNIVLIHLACHALYRCFQLLVSPSVIASSSSLNNKIIIERIKNRKKWFDKLPAKLGNTIYVLGMMDFSMDISWRGFAFLPWKKLYRKLNLLIGHSYILVLPLCILIAAMINQDKNQQQFLFALAFISIALYFSLRALIYHHCPFRSMLEFTLSTILYMSGLYILDVSFTMAITIYMKPVLPCLILSLMICWQFRRLDLRNFHAMGTKHTLQANLFMICFMVLSGMPISSAFLGEDMLLEELLLHSPALTCLVTLCFMINGLLYVKIYSRLFMGRASNVKCLP